jgi:hypothetical protein
VKLSTSNGGVASPVEVTGKWRAAKKILNIFSSPRKLVHGTSEKMAKHVSHTIFFPTIDLNYKNILYVVAQNMCGTACESSFLCSVSFMYLFAGSELLFLVGSPATIAAEGRKKF